MAQIITNQASIAYRYNNQSASAVSNIASAVLNDTLSVEKVSLESVYRPGDEITYVITVKNGGSSALAGVSVTDDLGAYTVGTQTVTPLTYTFVISNYGNAEATDIVLTDAFDPVPQNITVQVNGVAIPATDYDYAGGVLTLPNERSTTQLTLPPATVTQDPTTGEVIVTPSTLTVTVTGIILNKKSPTAMPLCS